MGRIKSAKSPDFCQSSSQENGTEHKAYYGLWTLPVSELLLIYKSIILPVELLLKRFVSGDPF